MAFSSTRTLIYIGFVALLERIQLIFSSITISTVVWLCHRWVRTSRVDPSMNHAANIDYLFAMNTW